MKLVRHFSTVMRFYEFNDGKKKQSLHYREILVLVTFTELNVFNIIGYMDTPLGKPCISLLVDCL